MRRNVAAARLKDQKNIEIKWEKWGRGVNNLLAPTKIRDDELSLGNNIILINEGSPSRRPGIEVYANDPEVDTIQGMFSYYNSNGTSKIVLVGDGIAYGLAGLAWSPISGASFATTAKLSAALINNVLYLANGLNPLTKFDGSGLTRFDAITAPASNWATIGGSLASGAFQYSYRVTAFTDVGETTAPAAFTVHVNKQRENWNPSSLPINEHAAVTVKWTPVTGAKGYNIYGINAGDERFLRKVDGQTSDSWVDHGQAIPSQIFPVPTGNGTEGPLGKYISEFKTSLLAAGEAGNPSRVYYSAGVDKPDSFLIGDGGGYVDISKNSSDGEVRGLSLYQDKAIVFKERSVWSMDFTESVAPAVNNVIRGIGAISHFAIMPVENDLFFLGRKPGGGPAIYILGNEPNYFNVLRTNELSARVRKTLVTLQPANFENAHAVYHDGRYILFFAEGGSQVNNSALVYDRERLGFTMWNDGINAEYPMVFYDENSNEDLFYFDNDDGRLTRMDENLTTDKGSPIIWNYKTKEVDLKDPFVYKRFDWVNLRFEKVGGKIEFKAWLDGTPATYSESIEFVSNDNVFGNAHFGDFHFGELLDEESTPPPTHLTRRLPIKRKGVNAIAKAMAVEVLGNTVNSRAALLDVQIEARPRVPNRYPREEIINS